MEPLRMFASSASTSRTWARVRSLHRSRVVQLAPPRIMSVDRVPGVKMANTGAPVREVVSTKAAAGADALKAAIARQRAERAAERQEAQALSEQLSTNAQRRNGAAASADATPQLT